MDVAIRTVDLRKRYRIGTRRHRTLRGTAAAALRRDEGNPESREVWALDGVSLEIERGSIVGIIGRNGAGKSTLLKVISHITYPTEGRVELRGRVGSLLEVGTGFHPELTGRDNIFLNGAILGMSRREIDGKLSEIVEFSGVERFIDTPLKFYSSGMAVRLGFAVAAYLEPEILIVDEVLSVGDLAFQERCLGKMQDVASGGRTVLFVSHNMGAISMLCPEAVWMEKGAVEYIGTAGEAISRYVNASRPGSDWLATQEDRGGSGRVRITGVAVEDDAGAPLESVRTGQSLRFVVDYEAERGTDLSQLTVNLVLGPRPNQGLVSFSSAVAGPGLADPPERGRVVCSVAELPLLPGQYNLQFSCLLGRELADKVHQAATLVVTEGDFFGTGRLPPQPEVFGPLVVHHQWTVEAAPEPQQARVGSSSG
jgi:homopolymeric O-antigen transport system ATP-binding protein